VCVRKPACFFSRWVKVGLPSDTVEGRAGRSAITRMRTDWPVPLCVPSKVHLAHRPCCYIWFRTQHRSQARNMPRCLVQEHAARHETDRNVFKKTKHSGHMHSGVEPADASASSHFGSKPPPLSLDWRAQCCIQANNPLRTVDVYK